MMPRATVSFYWESFRLLPSRRNTPVNTRRAFASHRAVYPFFAFTRVPLFPGAGVCFTLAATMIERCGAGMNDQKLDLPSNSLSPPPILPSYFRHLCFLKGFRGYRSSIINSDVLRT